MGTDLAEPKILDGRRQLWGCLAALLLVLVVVIVGCAFELRYLPIRPFDAEMWRHTQASGSTIRLSMVEWLVRSGRLDGLTRPQLLELLGPPTDSAYFQDWDLVYLLGPERGLYGIDSEWLVIRLGPDGCVAEYEIARD